MGIKKRDPKIRGLLSSSSGKEEDEVGEEAKWNKDVVDKDHLEGAVATMKETRSRTMTKSSTKDRWKSRWKRQAGTRTRP